MGRGRSYDYSPVHRAVEITGIGALLVIVAAMIREIAAGLGAFSDHAWWLLPTSLAAAWLAADLISGFVHFVADNFFAEDTPILGPALIKPFREHHANPRAITHHDFIETNGNSSLVSLVPLLSVLWLVPARTAPGALWVMSFFVFLATAVFLTNQLHKWAHSASPPAPVRLLQRLHLILPPHHHDVHHAPPHDTHYCITTGWLNAPLRAIRFFEHTGRLLRLVLRSQGRPAAGTSPPLAPGTPPRSAASSTR